MGSVRRVIDVSGCASKICACQERRRRPRAIVHHLHPDDDKIDDGDDYEHKYSSERSIQAIGAAIMAQYDLSKTLIPYLDRHLSFPLLAHLSETGLFPAKEVTAAQYELAKGTNMFDYAKGLFESIYPGETVPAGASRPSCLLTCAYQ